MNFKLTRLAQALGTVVVVTLAACGGGGGGTVDTAPSGGAPTESPAPSTGGAPSPQPAPTPTPATSTATLSGTVMVNQAIRNALVCLDVNANNACDSDEPTSARTGADGAYSLTVDATRFPAADLARISLIAPMVPGAVTDAATTIDAADPSVGNAAKAYVLRQVPGKAGQINPLTTLVASGIASGLTETEARANVALQLKIDAVKIDNYQDDPATNLAQVRDDARTMALVVDGALEDGVALQVGDQLAASSAGSGDLAALNYIDSGNYSIRTLDGVEKAAGTPGSSTLDVRVGRANGAPTSFASRYGFAYLAPTGWTLCDGPWPSTVGSPNRSAYCGVSQSAGYSIPISVAGRTMADVVRELQADPASVINVGTPVDALLAALGNAVFPAGSNINERHTLTLDSGIQIANLATDGRPQGSVQTFNDLIAIHQASTVILPAPSTSLTLGLGSSASRNLRFAFTGVTSETTGTVQYYECDLNAAATVASNCTATNTGTYAIETVHGARVMRFAGHAPTIMANTRLYVEVQTAPSVAGGNRVFQARQNKPDFASNINVQKRLNATAWAAMKTVLGL